MTSKELKRMSRTELLQMLLTLVEENEQLKSQLKDATEKLSTKNLKQNKPGSLAEAALHINSVFEGADKAAKQYLDGVKQLYEHQNTLIQNAEAAANKRAQEIIAQANAYKSASIREANEYWDYVRANVRNLMAERAISSRSPVLPKGTKR